MAPLEHIFAASVLQPLRFQVQLVNSSVVGYFMGDLRLVEHLLALRRYLLMQSGEFGHALTEELVEALASGVPARKIPSAKLLHTALARSLAVG